MSRFVLDCAVLRPLDDQTAVWLATSAQRAWADPAVGYHEGKVSNQLLHESASTMASLVGGASAWFSPDHLSGLRRALDDVEHSGIATVCTSEVDSMLIEEATAGFATACGVPRTMLEVDDNGRIAMGSLESVATPAVVLTSVGNQEIGALQTDLSEWAAATGSTVILDASCAWGWVDLPPAWDRIVMDPRSWGAPAGATVVVSRRQSKSPAFDNVAGAVVATLCAQRWQASCQRARELAGEQIRAIRAQAIARIPGIEVHGGLPGYLPHIVSISVLHVDAEAVQTRLDARGFAVGSGSACASRSGQPSHVLAAIGGLTSGNIRVGLPPDLDDHVVDRFITALAAVVDEVRTEMGTQDL